MGNAGRRKWSGARISPTRDRCDYRDFGLVELPAVGGEAAGHLLPGGGREGEPEGDLIQDGQPGECQKRQTIPRSNNCPAGSTLLPRGLVGTGQAELRRTRE